MNEIGDAFCPNKQCKEYGLQNHGNITVRGKYGKDKAIEVSWRGKRIDNEVRGNNKRYQIEK